MLRPLASGQKALLSTGALLAVTGALTLAARPSPPRMPYAGSGLDGRGAAAHLLSRFTFGARPGDVDRVVEMGMEAWFDAQLAPERLSDAALDARMAGLPALRLDAETLARTYPPAGRVLTEAVAAGVVARPDSGGLRAVYASGALQRFAAERGYRPERELSGQLVAQKVLRAAYSERQLQEVLTDFWFNHFNVAAQDGPARVHLLAYERDAIRPGVLGRFRGLLGATAKHPAMLLYLDNAQSVAPESVQTTLGRRVARAGAMGGLRGRIARRGIEQGRARARRAEADVMAAAPETLRTDVRARRRARGVNENYARELMELHTLGVDGGYTQADVENVARAFTGWTVWPANARAAEVAERRWSQARRAGAVRDGLFLFRPDAHDATAKTILGQPFPGGGGLDEGERVLDLVAVHPATARRIARALAVRFVSDDPPAALVEALARVFAETDGDVRAVVRALPYQPVFWTEAARAGKVKSPFELAVSAVRATGAEIATPGPARASANVPARGAGRGAAGGAGIANLVAWVDRMGQPLYRYPAPTGFPDRADAWLNAGTLAARMNFGLRLATGAVPGVRLDPAGLLGGPASGPPESPEAAVEALAARLLPPYRTGDLAALTRLARQPDLAARLAAQSPVPSGGAPAMDDEAAMDASPADAPAGRRRGPDARLDAAAPTDTGPLAQALGVLLGSPAFQRR